MNVTDWLGTIGVFQILLAYFLNVRGKMSTKSLSFILLNLIGATMACIASILLNYWPFIVLEGVWALVSLYSLISYKKI
ncbi:MAG: hypothetical protein R2783_02425 [Gelidibacter sp.]